MCSITRTASLGSLEFSVSVTQTESGTLAKSFSSPGSLDLLLSVAHKGTSLCEPVPEGSEEADTAEATYSKVKSRRTYLRLHVSTPIRRLLVIVLPSILIPSTAAAATFLHYGLPHVAKSSGTEKQLGIARVTTQFTIVAPAVTRTPSPRAAFPGRITFTWPNTDDLRPLRPDPRAAEAALRGVQKAAQAELQKLRVQLAPLEHADQALDHQNPVPVPLVATISIIGSAINAIRHTPLDDEVDWDEPSSTAAPGGVDVPAAVATATSTSFSSTSESNSVLPDGFQLALAIRAAELCGYCYHSCDPKDKAGQPTHIPRLHEDLAASGLRLVAELESSKRDTYALVARDDADVYLAFRGSCTLKNAQTDIMYQPADAETMAAYHREAAELGVHVPKGIQVHAGFLDAWRSLRIQVIEQIAAICEEERATPGPSRPLRLVVTGHSMGGAMAMFASLELASILRKADWNSFTDGHLTYTYAAPRVGNAKFARLYNLAFPRSRTIGRYSAPTTPSHICRSPRGASSIRTASHSSSPPARVRLRRRAPSDARATVATISRSCDRTATRP